MNLRDVIAALAQPGWAIRYHTDEHGIEYWTEGPLGPPVNGGDVTQLINEGWLESFNGGYKLSDAGRAAYLRSTDELGDGKLVSPQNGNREP